MLTVYALTALTSTGNVTSVSPSTNLVDGASYTMIFSYQDDVANARASVISGVTFAHNTTLPPVLSKPSSSVSYTESKPVDLFLYETAMSTTVKMTISWSKRGRWATADDAGDRIITFASAFETAGRHTCTLDA